MYIHATNTQLHCLSTIYLLPYICKCPVNVCVCVCVCVCHSCVQVLVYSHNGCKQVA